MTRTPQGISFVTVLKTILTGLVTGELPEFTVIR